MKKKASLGQNTFNTLIYLVIIAIFFAFMLIFINSKVGSAPVWGEFYAKEIANIVNYAKAGDEIILNVHKAASIAKKNKIAENEIFDFNNLRKEICVKTANDRKYCYSYFNNVDVTEVNIKWGEPVNLLSFKIRESAK